MIYSSKTIKRLLTEAERAQKDQLDRMKDGWVRRVDNKIEYYGYADFSERKIGLNMRAGDVINTIIHEEIHREHPN